MTVITRKSLARGAAASWWHQYYERGLWLSTELGSSKEIYEDLVALGSNPDPDIVDAIIGNRCWTYLECDNCDREVDKAFIFSRYNDSLKVCRECLESALEQL